MKPKLPIRKTPIAKHFVRAFILISFLLSLSSLFGHLTFDYQTPNDTSRLIISLWYTAILMLVTASLISWFASKKNKDPSVDNSLLILIIVCIIALIPRLIKLDHLGIFLDERYWIQEAQGLLNGKIVSLFGFVGDQPSNMPALIVSLILKITNNIYYAVRLPGVIYSIGFLCFLFLFTKQRMGIVIAFLVSLLFATGLWDIHMSRWGWNNVTPNPFIIMGIIYFYSKLLDRPTTHIAIVCGIFMGIAINLLYVSMLMIVPIVALIPIVIFSKRAVFPTDNIPCVNRNKTLAIVGIFCISIFITSAPTIAKVIKYPTQSIQRHKSFVAENIVASKSAGSRLSYYSEQFVLVINDFTPALAKYNIRGLWGLTLNYTTYITMILGLIYIIVKRRNREGVFIVVSFLIMFAPVVILNRTTSVWREYAFVPTVYIFSAYGMYAIYQVIRNIKGIGTPIFILCMTGYIMTEFIYGYAIFSRDDLSATPLFSETLCKQTSEYVVDKIAPTKRVFFPDQLCSDLAITAIAGRHPNVKIYPTTPSFRNNEVVIYYTISRLRPSFFITENDMDTMAYKNGFRKLLIAKVGKEKAYAYVK